MNKDEQRIFERLSYIELRVLAGVVASHSDTQIALEVGLTKRQVSTYVSQCLEKTGTHDRVALAIYVVRRPGLESAIKRFFDSGMTEAERKLLGSLTRKERRLLLELMQGDRNRDIAQRMKTTEQCIKNYFQRVFDKTGMGNRLELALFMTNHPKLLNAIETVVTGGGEQ